MNEELPVDDLIASLQPGIDLGITSTVNLVGVPFFRIANGPAGEVIVGAHDRAPEVTSQINIRFKRTRGGKITTQDMNIEIPVVVDIDKLTTPGPTGSGNRDH